MRQRQSVRLTALFGNYIIMKLLHITWMATLV
jgi:hypothetical protein